MLDVQIDLQKKPDDSAGDSETIPQARLPGKRNLWKRNLKEELKKHLSSKILFMMNACVRCGLCAEACHYACSVSDPGLIPAVKSEKLSIFLKKYLNLPGIGFPFLRKADLPGDGELSALYKAAFEDCTLCGKCAFSCPMGINAGEILSLARTLLCTIGREPAGLTDRVDVALKTGNYVGLTKEDFIETIKWIAEEMEDDIGEDGFSIPIDKQGAQVLYVPHPLEVRDFPFLVMYPVKIFHAAGEDYTFSSYGFDSVNYAFYQGSRTNMMQIAQRMMDAREKLGAKRIVLAPCGHGYRVMRWETEKCLGRPHPFTVLSIIERIDRYIAEGRIRPEKDTVEGPITYHDPCNIARRGGIINAPRNIMKEITSRYVEMQPHGMLNFCCGSGGGLGAMADYGQTRIKMGKVKADQIRKTGARIVATGCFNCMTQIRDLNKAYDLGIKVKSIVELVAESLRLF
jgi:Fe-S oxidoreductase